MRALRCSGRLIVQGVSWCGTLLAAGLLFSFGDRLYRWIDRREESYDGDD